MDIPLAHGSVPPMVTPMTPDAAAIDPHGVEALVNWHIDLGTTGLFVICSTGEMFDLTPDEMVDAVETAVNAAAGLIPIVAGLPFPDVERKSDLAKRYEQVGAAGAVALQPYEDQVDEDVWYEHYMQLADAVKIPLLIYEHPKWPARITPDLVRRLAGSGRYVGMKDCTGDIERLAAMAKAGEGRYGVMQAVQEQLISAMLCGGSGGCCTASNTHPHLYRKLYDLMLEDRIDEAYEVQLKIRRWRKIYSAAGSPKQVLNLIGLPVNVASRKKAPLNDEQLEMAGTLADLVRAEL